MIRLVIHVRFPTSRPAAKRPVARAERNGGDAVLDDKGRVVCAKFLAGPYFPIDVAAGSRDPLVGQLHRWQSPRREHPLSYVRALVVGEEIVLLHVSARESSAGDAGKQGQRRAHCGRSGATAQPLIQFVKYTEKR